MKDENIYVFISAKANYYHIYGYGVDNEYTYNKIYDMYAKGINAINEEGGREVKGAYIQYFFSVSHELYKASNEYYREQFLNDYLSSTEVCEKMLHKIDALNKELTTTKYMAIITETELLQAGREQEIEKRIAEKGLNLTALDMPPYIVKDK